MSIKKNYDINIFSEKIKKLRLSSKVSQQEIAYKIGMSVTNYQRLESGKAKPRIETVIKIMKYYNITFDSLFLV